MAMLRPLDLTLVSANDLKNVNLFTNMDLYAVVSLSADPATKLRTPVDHDCGSKPNWNHHMKLHIPEGGAMDGPSVSLHVLIRAEKTLGGDRNVGEVRIPIKELRDDAGPGNRPKVVTYQVRTSSGKAKGVLTLSYKFGDPVPAAEYPPPPNTTMSGEPRVANPTASGRSTPYPAARPQAE